MCEDYEATIYQKAQGASIFMGKEVQACDLVGLELCGYFGINVAPRTFPSHPPPWQSKGQPTSNPPP